MLIVHGTKRLLDRLKSEPQQTEERSTTALGDWYATAFFWRPQVALFVNESTLLPVLIPLAPATTVIARFSGVLGQVLAAHGASPAFVAAELTEMGEWRLAKTANRSVVGVMNEFGYLGQVYRDDSPEQPLLMLSLRLSETPCGPLYKRHVSPDRELAARLSELEGR